jgi:hypothetical protein
MLLLLLRRGPALTFKMLENRPKTYGYHPLPTLIAGDYLAEDKRALRLDLDEVKSVPFWQNWPERLTAPEHLKQKPPVRRLRIRKGFLCHQLS